MAARADRGRAQLLQPAASASADPDNQLPGRRETNPREIDCAYSEIVDLLRWIQTRSSLARHRERDRRAPPRCPGLSGG